MKYNTSMKRMVKKFTQIVFIFLFIHCKNEEVQCPMFSFEIISPYQDPATNKNFVIYNYRPISSINYTYGLECPNQAEYVYNLTDEGLYLIDRNNGNRIKLSEHLVTTPNWSENGDYISFSLQGSIFIYPFPILENEQPTIISGPRPYIEQSINPSLTTVAFSSFFGDSVGIWISDISTQNTNYFVYGGGPMWLNDSTIIYSDEEGIYSKSLSSKKSTLICELADYQDKPKYNFKISPDKLRIAFRITDISTGRSEYKVTICSLVSCDCQELPFGNISAFDFSGSNKIIYSEIITSEMTLQEDTGVLWEVDLDNPFNRIQITTNDNLNIKLN